MTEQKKGARIRDAAAIPGPRSRAITAQEAEHLAPGVQAISTLSGLAFARGEGAELIDVDGNRFLDFVAGICVASLGHGHPALAQAVARQAGQLMCGSFASESRLSLLQRLAACAPHPELQRVQLYSGGAEVVESALRLARAHTGRHEVIGFWGGFHGKTGGVLGLLGSEFKHGLGPLPAGQYLAPYPDPSRCAPGEDLGTCAHRCLEFLQQLIRYSTAGSLAAIVVEPMQGTAGNVIPPDDFLPAVAEIAHKAGALLIVDEMITGWGRTGTLWGSSHSGVAADIVTCGKGLGGGFPISALFTSDAIARAEPWSRPSFSSSSYGGNPLAAAAADAVTRTIVEERLSDHAAAIGAELLAALRPLQRYPFVGDVRGRGLLIGIDLVQDRKSYTPLPRAHCERLFHACLRRGLLTMAYTPRLRINPPLVLTAAQALEGAAILEESFAELAGWLAEGGDTGTPERNRTP